MKMHGVLAVALAALLLVPSAMAQSMMESPSDQGTFLVRISFTQDRLQDNAVAITFVDSETGKEVEDITYDFAVSSDNGSLVSKTAQTATVQHVNFGSEGSYKIAISNIDGLGEGATFDVRVTPEFQFVPSMVATGVSVAIFLGWMIRRNSLSNGW